MLLVAGAAAPAPDAVPARDDKAGTPGDSPVDPRVRLMLEECFRHAKVIGAWGEGAGALGSLGLDGDLPGIVIGDDAASVLADVQSLMASHRVWERFPTSLT